MSDVRKFEDEREGIRGYGLRIIDYIRGGCKKSNERESHCESCDVNPWASEKLDQFMRSPLSNRLIEINFAVQKYKHNNKRSRI